MSRGIRKPPPMGSGFPTYLGQRRSRGPSIVGGLLGLILMFLLILAINAAILAGVVYIVVLVLQHMAVI